MHKWNFVMEFFPEQEFKHSFKLLRKKGSLGGILTLVAFALLLIFDSGGSLAPAKRLD